jgi:hypothetical protein
VSIFGRLFGKRGAERPAADLESPAAPSPTGGRFPAPVEATALERLSAVGSPGGPDAGDALALLRTLHGTEHESSALAAVLELRDRAPEPLRVAAADLARSRGDAALALHLLEGTRSVPALVLASDVLAERGELARAVGTIERVLARDIDAPGARERQARWRERLGGRAPAPLGLASPACVPRGRYLMPQVPGAHALGRGRHRA